jgi:O-antigen/teichoic acid export membrane protein
VIAALCIATTLASLPTLLGRTADFVLRFDRPVRRRMRRVWQEHARWALMGAAASEMQTRGHVLAVSSFFSVADLGIIQAGLTLLRPVGLFGAAWAKVARPVMAKAFADNRPADAGSYANRSALRFAGMTAAYLVVLWLAWPLLSKYVLPSGYDGLGLVVPLWGATILIGLLRTVYSLEAQCVPLFREAFLASMIAMATILFGLTIAILIGTAASTILVIGAGEGAAMVALIIIIRRHVGRANRPAALPKGSRAT